MCFHDFDLLGGSQSVENREDKGRVIEEKMKVISIFG